MQNQMISIRRSVERKVPGYVKVIAFLLYAAALLFTILGAMFGILFLPLALGSLFGGWYLMGEARVIYEYRLDGKTLTVMRTSGMRSRQKEIEFFTLDLNDLIVVADEGTAEHAGRGKADPGRAKRSASAMMFQRRIPIGLAHFSMQRGAAQTADALFGYVFCRIRILWARYGGFAPER